jgi:hypothetical protein
MARKTQDAAPEQRFLRKVLSVTHDATLVNFHLACGHLITEHKADVPNPPPTQIDCWACRAEMDE